MQLPGYKAPTARPKGNIPANLGTKTSEAFERLGGVVQEVAVQAQEEAIRMGVSRANALTSTDSFTARKTLDSVEYVSGEDVPEGAKGLDGQPIARTDAEDNYRQDIPVYQARAAIYEDGMRQRIKQYAEEIPNRSTREQWIAKQEQQLEREVLLMRAQDLKRMKDFNRREWESVTEALIQQGNYEGVAQQLANIPGDPNYQRVARAKYTAAVSNAQLNEVLLSGDAQETAAAYELLGGSQEEYEGRKAYQGLSADERQAWRAQLKKKVDSAEVYTLADSVVTEALDRYPLNPKEARSQVRSRLKNKPEALKEAMKLYDAELARREREKQLMRRNLVDVTEQRIMAAGEDADMSMIPPVNEYYTAKDREAHQNLIIAQREGFSVKSKAATINYLRDVQANDPDKFAKVDMNSYRPDLSREDYLELSQEQDDLKKGVNDMARAGTSEWNKQVNDWITVKIGKPRKDWKTKDHQNAARLREIAQADYRRAVLTKGEALSVTERNDILFNVDEVTSDVGGNLTKLGFWWNEKPVDYNEYYRAPDLEQIQASRRTIQAINDQQDKYGVYIPHTRMVQGVWANASAEEIKQIEADLNAAQIPATEGNVMAEYLRRYNQKLPIPGFIDYGVRR